MTYIQKLQAGLLGLLHSCWHQLDPNYPGVSLEPADSFLPLTAPASLLVLLPQSPPFTLLQIQLSSTA